MFHPPNHVTNLVIGCSQAFDHEQEPEEKLVASASAGNRILGTQPVGYTLGLCGQRYFEI
jgi:hypothetical protein